MIGTRCIEAGQRWKAETRVLYIQGNGTPHTFNVARFNSKTMRIEKITVGMKTRSICKLIRRDGYVPSNYELRAA